MPSPNNTNAPSGGARGHCSHHRLPRRKLRLVQVGDFDLIHGSVQVHAKGGHIHKVSLAFSTLTSDVEVYSVGREAREYLLHPKNDLLRPMSGFGVHSWFKRALKAAGLPETIKMHEMRHSAADNLWRETGDIVHAKQLLRHTSVGTTEAYPAPVPGRPHRSPSQDGGQPVRPEQLASSGRGHLARAGGSRAST